VGTLTFPSGHAAAAAWLAAAVVSVGVIGLRWHYFTDTVGGAGTVCALALVLDLSWPPPASAARLVKSARRSRSEPGR
jgi:membrane-associated phospholipid phosphatase